MAEIPHAHINSPEDASVTGKPGCSSPYILSAGFPGVRGEALVHELELSGILVSTGAACSSIGSDGKGGGFGGGDAAGKTGGKYDVLKAIGVPGEVAEGTLRFGFSRMNTVEEIEFVVDRLKTAVERFRRVKAAR